MKLTAEQASAIARWVEPGADFLPVEIFASRPTFARSWVSGDVVAVQGEAHIQIDRLGRVREAAPPETNL